jgi:hypothetical protein
MRTEVSSDTDLIVCLVEKVQKFLLFMATDPIPPGQEKNKVTYK